jgi:hypothetical protein
MLKTSWDTHIGLLKTTELPVTFVFYVLTCHQRRSSDNVYLVSSTYPLHHTPCWLQHILYHYLLERSQVQDVHHQDTLLRGSYRLLLRSPNGLLLDVYMDEAYGLRRVFVDCKVNLLMLLNTPSCVYSQSLCRRRSNTTNYSRHGCKWFLRT